MLTIWRMVITVPRLCWYAFYSIDGKTNLFQLMVKELKFLEVQCENPGAPANGYAQGSAPYRAGDVVQFNCNPEYMMQGQPIIACQDSGRWSGVLPKCNFFFPFAYVI